MRGNRAYNGSTSTVLQQAEPTSQGPVDRVVSLLAANECDPRPKGPDRWEARCPSHRGSRHNLGIARGDDGRVLLYCHHAPPCTCPEIARAIGLEMKDLFPADDHGPSGIPRIPQADRPRLKVVEPKPEKRSYATPEAAIAGPMKQYGPPTACYVYRDANDIQIMRVYRFDFTNKQGEPDKTYRPIHQTADNRWRVGDPEGALPLYNLDDIEDGQSDDVVVVCEGEKAANAITSINPGGMGLIATTSAHGAGSPHRTDWSPLAGRDVVLMPDADDEGESYISKVTEILAALEPQPQVRVVRMGDVWESDAEVVEGADAFDWLDEGCPEEWLPEDARADLERAIARAEPVRLLKPEPVRLFRLEPAPVVEAPRSEPDEIGDGDGDDAMLARFPRTDLGNGERFAARFGRCARHVRKWGKWLVYDGTRWAEDDLGTISAMAKATARGILREASTIDDDVTRKNHVSWWRSSEAASRIAAMLSMASSEGGIPIRHDGLDADPWLFNTSSGTVDLRTGELRAHDPKDLVTAITPIAYDRHAACPRWERALERILPSEGVRRFFQRLCGLALTGVTSEQILPIFYGSGANGKSFVLNVLLGVLGDRYGLAAPPGLLVVRRGSSHPTELASLFGRRLVVDVESAENARLDETLVKKLTGGDKVTARRMREDFWEFAPTHKLIMCTNHRPQIKETKHAIWRRVLLVPFTVTIPPEEQIQDLHLKLLAEEGPGILAWCVRGCLDWKRSGLAIPDEVVAATKEYREEQDVLGEFLESECVCNLELKDQIRVKAAELYGRYREWTGGSGEMPLTQTAFGIALTERGFEKRKNSGMWYLGLGLRPKDSGESSY